MIYNEIKKLPAILRDPNISVDRKRDLVNMFLDEIRWNSNTQLLSISINT